MPARIDYKNLKRETTFIDKNGNEYKPNFETPNLGRAPRASVLPENSGGEKAPQKNN